MFFKSEAVATCTWGLHWTAFLIFILIYLTCVTNLMRKILKFIFSRKHFRPVNIVKMSPANKVRRLNQRSNLYLLGRAIKIDVKFGT